MDKQLTSLGPRLGWKRLRNCKLASPVLLGLASATLAASQWPAWRGPQATGSTEDTGYPVKWDAASPSWKVALPGKGSSSPIVWNERIYLTVPDKEQDTVLALNLAGERLWRTELGPASPPKHRTLGSSCNSSPVTDGQGVFVYFRSGLLAALEFDGMVRWQVNLVERFGQEQLFWDQGTSPVVTEKHVVMARLHGGESWVAGFDKATGELGWQQARNYSTPTENNNAYSTPVLFSHQGKPALLVWGADHLTAHAAADGALLWSCGGFNPSGTGYWPAIASPVVHQQLAIVPVGRDDRGQGRVHAIRVDGRGDVTATHRAWQRDDTGVFVSSPAEYQGRVYLLRHRGEVVCLDPLSGKTLWNSAFPKDRAPYYSSPVIAGGLLYAAREDGVVFVARVGDKFELLAENPMRERIVASPVPVAKRLLIRGDQHLFAVAAGR